MGTKTHWRFGDGGSIVYLSGGGDYLTHLAELDTLERGYTYTIPKFKKKNPFCKSLEYIKESKRESESMTRVSFATLVMAST